MNLASVAKEHFRDSVGDGRSDDEGRKYMTRAEQPVLFELTTVPIPLPKLVFLVCGYPGQLPQALRPKPWESSLVLFSFPAHS